jgi:Zn-dependent protease
MSTPEPIFTVEPPQGRAPIPKAINFKGWLAPLFVVLLKYKTVLSMLLSLWVYTAFFGWKFAAGIVVMIFIHEMGHVFVAKCVGIPVSAPLFIPFFGAAIVMKQNPRDAWTEALMAYGGPLAGGLGGWICFLAGEAWNSPLLITIAFFAFLMNLFNLIPIPPMDGGRICAAVSRWFWLLGLGLLSAAVVFFHAWILTVIAIIVLISAYQRVQMMIRHPDPAEMQRYYQLTVGTRAFVATFYLGLIAALLLGAWDANAQMQNLAIDQGGDSN